MGERQALSALTGLVARAPRARIVALGLLTAFLALTEGVGIMMIVPLLSAVTGDAAGGLAAVLPQAMGLGGLLALFVALVAVRAGLAFAQRILSMRVQFGLVDDLRSRCHAALIRADWRWLARQRASDHAALVLTNVARVGAGIQHALTLLTSIALIGAALAAAFILSWRLTLCALAGGALAILLFAPVRRAALRSGEGMTVANRAMQAHVQESLASVRQTKMLGREAQSDAAFAASMAALRHQHLDFVKRSAAGQALVQVAGAVLLTVMLGVGLTVWHVPLTHLAPLAVVVARLVPQISTAQQAWGQWLQSYPALAQCEALLAEAREQQEPPCSTSAPFTLDQGMRLESVSLHHEGRDRPALDAVSLTLTARTSVALSGPSGAGKSSVADLVAGLVSPDQGRVLVDGRALDGADRQLWRRGVAYHQQGALLLHDSIAANLRLARPDADEAALWRALDAAGAGFVRALPDGLHTHVGDAGQLLSGGERQRIALAQALIVEPHLLILDEPTSALDPETERQIANALEALRGRITILIIGHRPALWAAVDQHIRLDHGRVAEGPTHVA